jgi:metallophosphoesterase superfamily enzyme
VSDVSEFISESKKKKATLEQIANILERNGIDIEDIGSVKRINVTERMVKGSDGTSKTSASSSITLSPKWEDGPEWPIIQRAKPTVIKNTATRGKRPEGEKITVILPDPQIGYWRLSDGTMVPMHDEKVMEIGLQVIAEVKPDVVINLGDYLDMSEWSSKFTVYPEFVLTTQAALDRGHEYLAQQRALAGSDAKIVLLGGNHDNRLEIAVTRNSMAAMRLRRASKPESWPVLSIPFLLCLDEINVQYIGSYPAGRIKLAEARGEQTPLFALHGEKLDMKKQATSERQSTIQGHTHHVSVHMETYEIDGQAQQVQSWSLGCMCRIDGAVPSTKGGVDEFGRPYKRQESWQHAVGVLTETEDGWWIEPIMVHNGVAFYRGKTFRSA